MPSGRAGLRRSVQAGTAFLQMSMTYGQRGWKAQPDGRRSSDGARPGMPWNTPLFSRFGRLSDQRLGIGVHRVGEHLLHRAELRSAARHTSPPPCPRTAPSGPCRGRSGSRPRRFGPARGRCVSITWRCVTTSSALVGSSAMITLGLSRMPMAMQTRCFMPPDSSCGYMRNTLRLRSTDSSACMHALCQLCVGDRFVRCALDRVHHLRPDPHHRVERVHRALRDVGDLAQARLAHLLVAQRGQVDAADDHLAALDPARRLDHAHHRQRHGALARAGFADQPQLFPGIQGEADTVQRVARPASV